jgi:hypothetical protein
MPPPRKVDKLPSEQRDWLKQELKDCGFSGYEQIAEALNERLEEGGHEIRIQKSAIHSFGKEYETFVKYQEEASSWAADWMQDQGLEDEAKRHSVLFQMLTSLAFKAMKDRMDGETEVNPQELHFIGKMMKDIMASSGMREKLVEGERDRLAKEIRQDVSSELEKNIKGLGLTKETVDAIKQKILGVAG